MSNKNYIFVNHEYLLPFSLFFLDYQGAKPHPLLYMHPTPPKPRLMGRPR